MLSTDRRDLLLNTTTGDLVIGTDLSWSTGLPAIAQACRIVMQMIAGEWFLDLDAGIPYWTDIFGQRSDLARKAARIDFSSALRQVADVSDVIQMDVVFVGPPRQLQITWAVRSVFGNTSPDTILQPISEGSS